MYRDHLKVVQHAVSARRIDGRSIFDKICRLPGDELKRTVSIVVDLAATLDPDGVDIYFLNREPLRSVRSSEQLTSVFAVPPEGIRKRP